MGGEHKATVGNGGVIIGVRAIAALFGRSGKTIARWIERKGFPAAKLPSGHWATSTSLVDAWLMSRMKRPKVRLEADVPVSTTLGRGEC